MLFTVLYFALTSYICSLVNALIILVIWYICSRKIKRYRKCLEALKFNNILCTCASDSTSDLVYASVVKEYCNIALLSKIQQEKGRTEWDRLYASRTQTLPSGHPTQLRYQDAFPAGSPPQPDLSDNPLPWDARNLMDQFTQKLMACMRAAISSSSGNRFKEHWDFFPFPCTLFWLIPPRHLAFRPSQSLYHSSMFPQHYFLPRRD